MAVAAACSGLLAHGTSSSALLLRGAVSAEPSGPSCQDGADAVAAAAAAGAEGGGPPAASGPSSSPAATPTAPQQQQEVQLQFLSVLGRGRDGTVWSGVFNGQLVAIKVYDDGADAYAREVQVYHALAQLQGSVVPKVGGGQDGHNQGPSAVWSR